METGHLSTRVVETGLHRQLVLLMIDCVAVWQVIDPEMPQSGISHGSVTVRAPPDDILKLRQKYTHEVFLVVFYDTKRTW